LAKDFCKKIVKKAEKRTKSFVSAPRQSGQVFNLPALFAKIKIISTKK
jgi:hypothetical protein